MLLLLLKTFKPHLLHDFYLQKSHMLLKIQVERWKALQGRVKCTSRARKFNLLRRYNTTWFECILGVIFICTWAFTFIKFVLPAIYLHNQCAHSHCIYWLVPQCFWSVAPSAGFIWRAPALAPQPGSLNHRINNCNDTSSGFFLNSSSTFSGSTIPSNK